MPRINAQSIVAFLIMITSGLLTATGAIGSDVSAGSQKRAEDRLAWWRDARFGMFIHWGPVSLKGTEIGWSRGKEVPVEEYDELYKDFNPTRFDADEWVRIAKTAGMKYVVITSKHHDGFCIWPSEFTEYDIAATPFKRDILAELSQACRKQGLRFCTYHSICDWHHPDYPTGSPGGRSSKPNPNMPRYFEYLKNQTREIIQHYGPLGIMWFDGEWERPWTPDYGNELYGFLRGLQPDLIINNRVSKGREGMDGTTTESARNPGDYDTPEQRVGAFSRERPWETCMTICRQWAWKPNDDMKSLEQCIDALVRTAGGDGNFLFNVGPMPDGRIEPRQVERLKEMGAWLDKYGETIYGTRGGPFKPGPQGVSTCKDNKVYVHMLSASAGDIVLPPLPLKVVGCTLLTGGDCDFEQDSDEIRLEIASAHRREIDTIAVLTLDGAAEAITPVEWCSPSGSLAFGKAARASNTCKDQAKFAPSKAVDGDRRTRWATDGGTTTAWLEVDLGKPMTINRVWINEAAEFGRRIRRFQIEYKEGDAWKVALQGRTIGNGYEGVFPAVKTRYVRLNILKATEGPTIWEFLVFNTPAGSH